MIGNSMTEKISVNINRAVLHKHMNLDDWENSINGY